MSADDELLDVLGDDGLAVAQKPRRLVHSDHDLHGLVFVWSAFVRAGSAVMVLQRRGRPTDPFATQVDALAGGHIAAGETPVDAARRELAEEVGVTAGADDFVHLGSNRMYRPSGNCRRVVQSLLLYPVPVDLARLRFSDEVDGFVEVDLDGFADLVHDRRQQLPARTRLAADAVHPVGSVQVVEQSLPRSAVAGYPDEILDTFRRSLSAIRQWVDDGRVDAGHFE